MISTANVKHRRYDQIAPAGAAALMLAKIWVDRRWPDSLAAAILFYVWSAYFLAWFGSKIWTGYQRRKPYWTRASWIRFFRLAAMPVGVLIVFFALVFAFDAQPTLFGSRGSTVRVMSALLDLALMFVGVAGVMRAIDWLERGEASEPFTRTRWFQRKSEVRS